MEPIQEREFGTRSRIMPTHFHVDWIPVIHAEMPLHMRHLLEWLGDIAASMGRKYPELRGRRKI